MARRGRPPGADSDQTRATIVDVSRRIFSERGYSATSVAAIAEASELAPSAIYHYFGGKAELYEAVFEATVERIWSDFGAASRGHSSLLVAVEQMVSETKKMGTSRPNHADFLALVPMEARLNRNFGHLLERRTKYLDETFGAMGRLGIESGELRGFTEAEATEVVRTIIMGWFLESYFRGASTADSVDAILKMFKRIAQPQP